MICDKVRDVDEIDVFICADGTKLRGGKRRCEPTIYVNRPWESVVPTATCEYWGTSSQRRAKSVPFEELHVVVREGRLGELVYCRT